MKDVILSIKGLFGVTEDGDVIELVTEGRYNYSDNQIMVEYDESELTDMDGTKTTLTVSPSSVMIVRKGTVTMQMLFEQGKKNYFAYNTPYGTMTLGVETHSIDSRLGPDGGELEVNYVLDLANTSASKNTFHIDVRNA